MDKIVILHVSDWNLEDKYYEAPISILKSFVGKIIADGLDGEMSTDTWRWWSGQVNYGDETDKPIKFGVVDMRLDIYFIDYQNCLESANEIKEML